VQGGLAGPKCTGGGCLWGKVLRTAWTLGCVWEHEDGLNRTRKPPRQEPSHLWESVTRPVGTFLARSPCNMHCSCKCGAGTLPRTLFPRTDLTKNSKLHSASGSKQGKRIDGCKYVSMIAVCKNGTFTAQRVPLRKMR